MPEFADGPFSAALVARDHDALVDSFDAFFFVAFGVLSLGDTPIAGAIERLSSLRRAGRVVKMVSNAGNCSARLSTAFVVCHGVSAELDGERAITRTGIVPNHVIDHI